ncbi:DUF1592 domain-containing protein [Telmatocola sphagniphila]|uniref:DUF1592 domain-containing protein n=1 Tax=Telmatocola sphagniphila TaxID=1123043 RepID=A0A8E6BB87_9BACT|nr:DUF1592 domain-containing protein [Telmatocola sphagniphila]QVL34742.1 DUF1592 domain-containing protein [Telmatocola sphagniphila]
MGYRPFVLFLFIALAVFVYSWESVSAEQAKDTPVFDAAAAASFEKEVVPFLSKYCLKCHNETKKSAGLSLEKYRDAKSALKDRRVWLDVVSNIHSREMPPEDSKVKPTPAEREKIEALITESLTKVDCGVARDPGRPTLRRLNKAEYANTIRDLVGVTFNPSEDFPSDDVGYGFDNIGDVLSMPPILLEKYMRAAERIMEEAIIVQTEVKPTKNFFRAQAMQGSAKGFKDPAARPVRMHMTQGGMSFVNFEPDREGEFTVKVQAFAENNTSEAVKMSFQIDKKEIKAIEIKGGTQQKPEIHEFKAKMTAGKHQVGFAFTNPPPAKNKDEKRSLSIVLMELEGPFHPAPKPPTEAQKRIMITTPKTKQDEEPAARKILQNFASKAYRRPATTEEVDRLMRLYKAMVLEKEPFELSVAFALRAVLVSPNFLFRIEQNGGLGETKAAVNINDYELATRLSYFLWSSMPDDELTQLASKGHLRRKDVLELQVRRMLKDPKASALTQNFASQWLQLRTLDSHIPDRKTFPEYDTEIKNLMVKETQSYFDYIVKEDRSILEFLDSNYTFLNQRLARFYGINGVNGNDFKKYTFNDPAKGGARGGILSQGSILTLTSNPTRTSPVKRGKWVLENILGTPPPPPPPDVPPLPEGSGAELTGSLRQRMEQHRVNAICASCHAKMDPIGFGMENYTAVGTWRANDGKYKIDASGTLPSGDKFDGPTQLRKVLISKADLFRRNLAEKMLTYAIGRGTEYYDKCAIDDIVKGTLAGNDQFSALILSIVQSDPFQKRRVKED